MAVADALTGSSQTFSWTLGDSQPWACAFAAYSPAAGGNPALLPARQTVTAYLPATPGVRPSWYSGAVSLMFDDEFTGTSVDTTKWGKGWQAASGISGPVDTLESSAYNPTHITVSGGTLQLLLDATSISSGGHTYPNTAGILTSDTDSGTGGTPGFTFNHGAVEARIFVPPQTSGSQVPNWPTFWMTNPASQQSTNYFEIDMMEGLGGGTAFHVHWFVSSANQGSIGVWVNPQAGWHTFGCNWVSGQVDFYYDGVLVGTLPEPPGFVSAPQMFMILLNTISPALPSGVGGPNQLPTTAQYDWVRVWTATPAAPVPPMSSLSDDFGNSATIRTLWGGSTVPQNFGSVSIAAGVASIPANATDGQVLQSGTIYNLTGSFAFGQVTVATGAGTTTGFGVNNASGSPYPAMNGNPAQTNGASVYWLYDQATNHLTAILSQGVTDTTVGAITYSATTHAWQRIRESGGTLFWDTSPDGITWTNQFSHSYSISVTQMFATAWTQAPSDQSTTAFVDHFNVISGVSLPVAQVSVQAFTLTPTTPGTVLLPAAQVSARAFLPSPPSFPLSLVSSKTGGAYNVPGPQYVVPNNAAGNLLVVFAAWDVSATATSGNGVVPVCSVADDQYNWWRLACDTGSTIPGCRAAAWFCSNALAVNNWLSVCPQGYVSSFAFIVAEFSGAPANFWPLIDFAVPAASNLASTLPAAGAAGASDYVFTLGAIGSTVPSLTQTAGGWTTITTTSQGGLNPSGIKLMAQFGTAGAGGVPSTFQASTASPMAALTFGITQASHLPAQVNPNFPRLFVEAALGSVPGDPTAAIPDTSYTDLSSYCIGPAGQTAISTSGGRQYELSQPESGTATIAMNNQTGAFNPSNTASPFYPDIVPGVPVRVSAQYGGRRYPVWAGYVERWPQDFPDFPQWGWSMMVATDGVGVASSVNLPSAVQGEILADEPYFCFPFGEQYTTSQNTVNGVVKTATETDGLVAVNTAPGSQRTATYIDGASQQVQTGQSLGFLGDSGTGMGTGSFSGFDASGLRGPGVQYGPDYGLPLLLPGGVGDCALEFWFLPPTQTAPGSTQNIQLFEMLTQPYLAMDGGFNLGGGVFIMGGISYRSDGTMAWYTQEAWSNTTTAITNLAENQLHHIVINISNGGLEFWLDGIDKGNVGGMPYPNQVVAFAFGLATYAYGNHGQNANFSMAYPALYPYVLPGYRIVSHYQSGISGFAGDTLVQRAGRYMAWGRTALGLAGPPVTDHLLLSSAYSTAGAPLASALNSDVTSAGGLWFVSPGGNLVVLPRDYLYNQPSLVTFGDNVGGGEIPFEVDTAFDFDNTYLQNSAQATLQEGPNSLALPVVRDSASQAQYFQRGPLQQTISATTPGDAADRANWSLFKYRQPSLRVRQMKVNLASRPSAIQAVLQTTAGDVATVNRRPLTQGSYSLPVVVGKVQHDIGPGKWETTYQMYPYVPEDSVLTADTLGTNVLGSNVLAW